MALSIIGFILLAILYFKILLPQKESMLHGLKGYYYEKQKADESSRIKSAFIANMTHELRTPMNGVIGFSQLLKETQLNPEQESYLGNLDKASHALLEIINDILDFSKLESGNIVINSVNVNHQEITHEIVSILHPIAIQKNIEIKYIIDENFVITPEAKALNDIRDNLMENFYRLKENGEDVVNSSIDPATQSLIVYSPLNTDQIKGVSTITTEQLAANRLLTNDAQNSYTQNIRPFLVGKNIFISDRKFVTLLPAFIILVLTGYIDFSGGFRMYLTFLIFLIWCN